MIRTAPVDRLRRITAAFERGELVPPEDAAWFAKAFRVYEQKASDGLHLDRALGLIVGAGQKPWWRVEEQRRRDEELRALAAECFGDLDVTEAARRIAQEASRYAATGWRHEQAKPADEAPQDPKRHRLRRALTASGGRVLGARQLKNILKTSADT